MAGEGLVPITPSSVSFTGTSATINATGGVDFTLISVLSLNDVFSSAYTNYCIYITSVSASVSPGVRLRFRLAGTDATGSDYVEQALNVTGTSINPNRATTSGVYIHQTNTVESADFVQIYAPALATATATRCISAWGNSLANMYDVAGTHGLTTAYDGFTLITDSSINITGSLHVFGYEE